MSGVIGLVTGKSWGLEHIDEIHDNFDRILEGVYAVASIIGLVFYKKYKVSLRDFLNNIDSKSKKL